MTFSGLFFVLVFLPAFLIVYSLARTTKSRNAVLLVFSVIFYSFAGIGYLILVIAMSFFGWYMAARIWMERKHPRRKKAYLAAGVAALIAVLGIFKYTGFVEKTINDVFGTSLKVAGIVLPLGISFYTFKLLSYLADVYRGEIIAELSFAKVLIYTMSFHHVMQGPIIRFGDIRKQLYQRERVPAEEFSEGLFRFVTGLWKKVVLADYCGTQASVLLPLQDTVGSQTVLTLWLGSAFFTMQMYLDFSSYTDMAIGLGRMSGFTYMENFNYPYTAFSVTDFWRRWHISLSLFFRDYVYIPMGGSRVKKGRHVLNLFVVWLLTGLWHGASWNFILWGLYYFVFVTAEHMLRGKLKEPGHVRRFAGHIYALLVVNTGWVIFRYTDFTQMGAALRGMFAFSSGEMMDRQLALTVRSNLFFIIVSVLFCTPLLKKIDQKTVSFADRGRYQALAASAVRISAAVLMLVWSILGMAGNTYTPFLYNQF